MAALESLNHTALCVHDLLEATHFYCDVLGAVPAARSNFQIEQARSGVAIFQSVILEDYLLALTVAPEFMPMPPADQLRGAHGFRHGFVVQRRRFGEVQAALREHGIRFEGPVAHPDKGPFGESIYFKDPSGNFLEILWRRDEDPNDNRKRRYVNVE
jgi:catechol-2,3-dioxygenase